MTPKTFIPLLAIVPRRRLVASTIVYGLSLAVRFTSATGEQVEIPAQYVQGTDPVMTIMNRDGASLPYADWSLNETEPVLFRQHWPRRMAPSCSSP